MFLNFAVFVLIIISYNNSYASSLVKDVSEDAKIVLNDDTLVEFDNIYIPFEIREHSVEYIKNALVERSLNINLDAAKRTPYNNYLVDHIQLENGELISSMLKNGLALIYSTKNQYNIDNKDKLIERDARKERLGLWSNDKLFFNEQDLLNEYKKYVNSFILVKGGVHNAKLVKNTMYINFGNDWRTDFTVKIQKKNLKNFKSINFDKIAGNEVLVRGWIEDYNGPMMEIYNASHLDIL